MATQPQAQTHAQAVDRDPEYETVDELLARVKRIDDPREIRRLLAAEEAAERPRKTAVEGLTQRLSDLRSAPPSSGEAREASETQGAYDRTVDREEAAPLLGEPGTYPVGQTAATSGPIGEGPGERIQLGGTIIEGGRAIGYTRKGALSAVPGGPPDPTILPPGYEAGGAQSGSTGPATGGAPAGTSPRPGVPASPRPV